MEDVWSHIGEFLTNKEVFRASAVNKEIKQGLFYNKREIRGWIYLSAEAAALTSFIIFRGRGNDYIDQYDQTEDAGTVCLREIFQHNVYSHHFAVV